MSRKIVGVTVGTPISPEALKKKLNIEPDSGGNQNSGWTPTKAGTVILPEQTVEIKNGFRTVGAIDPQYLINNTKIIVYIDGIPHESTIIVDGYDLYANVDVNISEDFNGQVSFIFATLATTVLGIGIDMTGHTVRICLLDYNVLPEECIPESGGNVDLTGVVRSVNGVTPDENGNVQIAVSSGGGWTTEQIDLLDSLLSNVSFNSENGGAIADMLIASLRSGASSGGGSGDSGGETEPDNPSVQTYTITRNLTGCTSSSSLSSVVGGVSHNETITANAGYISDGATVSVIMGGVDITATAYSNGVIDIASVTGNIVISAVMVNAGLPVYELAEATAIDGTEATMIDTGVVLFDEDKDWSIAFDFVVDKPFGDASFFNVPQPGNKYENSCIWYLHRTTGDRVYVNGQYANVGGNVVWISEKAGNTVKVVLTHAMGTNTVNMRYFATNIAGKTESDGGNGVSITPGDGWPQSERSLIIGNDKNSGAVTANSFKIYKRVLTSTEISAYLT